MHKYKRCGPEEFNLFTALSPPNKEDAGGTHMTLAHVFVIPKAPSSDQFRHMSELSAF